MSDSHIPGRPGPGIYANGGVHSPRYRLPLVGEAATDHPVPPRLADQPAPIRTTQATGAIRTTQATGAIRTFTINEATQRGNQ